MNSPGKSLGSRFQHEIFYFMVRMRLLFLAKISIRFVVLYYSLLPSVRKRSYPYLSRRFPEANAFSRWIHCYKLYLCFAEGLLQRIALGILGKDSVTTTSASREYIKDNLPKDSGCIILTGHIGAWQLGLAGVERLNRPVNIVQWVHEEDNDRHYFEHEKQKDKHDMRVINSRDGVEASFAITAALQRKEIVCIGGDRITDTADTGIDVTFLGDTIQLPTIAYVLASITKVPLIVSFSVLTDGLVHGVKSEILHVPNNLRRNREELRKCAQSFAAIMEDMVQEYPYHFFNFLDMWEKNDTTRM